MELIKLKVYIFATFSPISKA